MCDNRPLKGLRILVTRPGEKGARLAGAIEAAGGEPVVLPLMNIEPVTDPASQALLQEQIQSLDQYDLLVFISSNAAEFGLQWIDRFWPQFPVGIEVVAIGSATAQALAGLPCRIATPAAGMRSEELLELPQLTHVNGKRIALFRGVGGRELLAETLISRGARVDYVETYRRKTPARNAPELRRVLAAGVDIITVTSGQMLDSLCSLVGSEHTGIDLVPLLVPSRRVRDQALAAGFTQVYDCNGATDDVILATLKGVASQLAGPRTH